MNTPFGLTLSLSRIEFNQNEDLKSALRSEDKILRGLESRRNESLLLQKNINTNSDEARVRYEMSLQRSGLS